jgi:hypothetical protein
MKISPKDLIGFENNRRKLFAQTENEVGDLNFANWCNLKAAVDVLINKGVLPLDFKLEWNK